MSSRRQAEEEREDALRERLRHLTDDQRRLVLKEFNRRLKDADSYAVLNYLFIAGLHHFYLGQVGRGVLNILVFWGGVALMVSGWILIGLGVIVLITILELKELFFSQTIVLKHNNDTLESIMEKHND